jgi:hypothetical protein
MAGDERYPSVPKTVAPDASPGWTVGWRDRATRFLGDMPWGRNERKMLTKALGLVWQVIEQTGDLTLLTDGERRYGRLWFALCRQARRNGTRGRPKKTVPQGVPVRLTNQGSQRHQRGPKRPQ